MIFKIAKHQKWMFPLIVDFINIPYKVCYSLYDPELENRNMKYLLYESNNVQIKILLSPKAAGKRARRGAIQSLEIISPDGILEIDSSSILTDLQMNSSHFSVESMPGREVTIEVEQARFKVYHSKSNKEFYVSVEDNNSINGISGILGQIFEQDVEVVREYKKKRAKLTKVILKMGRKNYSTKERSLSDDFGPNNSCLRIEKGESRLYNMAEEYE